MQDIQQYWNTYFYDPPHDDVLVNIPGILNQNELKEKEYAEAAKNEILISSNQIKIHKTYDSDHIKSIHKSLFGDIYPWAGQYRKVNLHKNMSSFSNWYNGEIDRQLIKITNGIHRVSWQDCSPSQFVLSISLTYSIYNIAHPFREGNGRTGKLFLSHVSELSPYKISFRDIDPEKWNLCSMMSSIKASPEPVENIFWKHTRFRDTNKSIPYSPINLNERMMLTRLFDHTKSNPHSPEHRHQAARHQSRDTYLER